MAPSIPFRGLQASEFIFQPKLEITSSLRTTDLTVVPRALRMLSAEFLAETEDGCIGHVNGINPELHAVALRD